MSNSVCVVRFDKPLLSWTCFSSQQDKCKNQAAGSIDISSEL
jgi:hypothetical protein